MRTTSLLVVGLFLIIQLTGCTEPLKNENGVSLELAEFRKEVLSEIHYDLTLEIPSIKAKSISGRLELSFNLSRNSINLPLDFRADAESIHSINVNNLEAEISFENEHILLPKHLLNEGANNVTIDFKAGESSLNRNDEYLYTLFVPDRARTAFPLFDQPNLKAIYSLSLEIASDWSAISNAPIHSKTEKDSTAILEFEPSDMISSYLFSFVAGKFDVITKEVSGREMTLLHRETDQEKVARNVDDIFELHASSIGWLEEYTGIPYPFKKFDFALIPSFQYGGMEHVGAIQYRASSLLLDEAPSESRLLGRASLIAHETAHMWFGDLVTMDWFNDVWTKEVFANFMAAKIVNPSFPEINHELNFLVRHYPSAYSVDRTSGANPIRQELPNLNEAGTMYGAIIYNKAPIMMRQLELLIGKDVFQQGLQEYLSTYSFSNATWLDLITILDQKTETDLTSWSEVWVNTSGRPHFNFSNDEYNSLTVIQKDPEGENRVWPQTFGFKLKHENEFANYSIKSDAQEVSLVLDNTSYYELANSDGYGYGLFPTDIRHFELWDDFGDVEKGSLLINIYENVLERNVDQIGYLEELTSIIQSEKNQLVLNLALGHFRSIYWGMMLYEDRITESERLEQIVWNTMLEQEESSRKKMFFNTFQSIALSESGIGKLRSIWNKELTIEKLILSENDFIGLAGTLAIKLPDNASEIVNEQLSEIKNPDRKRRFEFIKPALSSDPATRDAFFESLALEENRQTESWVLGALGYLHHPLRTSTSEKYILPSLELLEEIQVTGDIFFPKRWLDTTLGNHHSDEAVLIVNEFLNSKPKYNAQLKMKILQSADMLFRTNNMLKN